MPSSPMFGLRGAGGVRSGLRNVAVGATFVTFLTFSTKLQANESQAVVRKERDPAAVVRKAGRGLPPLVDAEGCLMLPENGLLNRTSESAFLSLFFGGLTRDSLDLSDIDLSAYDTREEIQQALGDLLASRGFGGEPGDYYGPSQHVDFFDWDADGDLDAFVGLKSLNFDSDRDSRGVTLPPIPPGTLTGSYGLGALMYFENVTGEEESPFPEDFPYFMPRFGEGPLGPFSKGFDAQAYFGNPAPRVADLDDDGIPELYVGVEDGRVLRFLVNDDEEVFRGLPYDPESDVFEFDDYLQVPVDERGSTEDLDVGANAVPAFFDQDGDGTVELFVGRKATEFDPTRGIVPPDWEPVYMYRSDDLVERGTPLPLVWQKSEPEDNPFVDQEVVGFTAPVFVDIDGDTDEDAFIGAKSGLHYFANVNGAVRGGGTPAVFAQQFGTDHPLLGAQTLLHGTAPAFADIEGDGDLDYFAGAKATNFVENRGTATDPAFLDMGHSTEFADLDGDGDLDALAGGKLLQPFPEVEVRGPGTLLNASDLVYFENVGTPENPIWERRLGEDSPVAGLLEAAGFELFPDSEIAADLVDIDGDGDLDLFVGTKDDGLQFFLNDGTPQNAAFVLQPSPFATYNDPDLGVEGPETPIGGFFTSPDPFFVDLDGDGDYDAVIGNKADNNAATDESDQALRYFENVTGESRGTGVVFEERLAEANPFDDIDNALPFVKGNLEVAAPWLVDYDHDGDYDLFVGSKLVVGYYENVGDNENPSFDEEPRAAFWLSRLPELLDEFALRGLDEYLAEFDYPSLGFWNFSQRATPAVVDIDADGDYDGFVGAVGLNEAFRAPGGIVVEPVPVVTSELGDAQVLMVSLKSMPPAAISVEIEVSDATEAELSTTMLSFTPDNWDTPQPVTVTGLPDALVDGDIAYQVIFKAFESGDPRLEAIPPCAVLAVDAINLDDEARAAAMVVTKEVYGPNTMPGDVVTYVIEVTNVSAVTQNDLMGPEFEDTLPPELMLLSADASSGVASSMGNTVSWNGSLPPGGSVTITVEAEILDVPGGTEVVNQGTGFFDGDDKGESNDAMVLSDDPNVPGIADETRFVVGQGLGPPPGSVLAIPTMSQVGGWAMGALLALFALVGISRQRP